MLLLTRPLGGEGDGLGSGQGGAQRFAVSPRSLSHMSHVSPGSLSPAAQPARVSPALTSLSEKHCIWPGGTM